MCPQENGRNVGADRFSNALGHYENVLLASKVPANDVRRVIGEIGTTANRSPEDTYRFVGLAEQIRIPKFPTSRTIFEQTKIPSSNP